MASRKEIKCSCSTAFAPLQTQTEKLFTEKAPCGEVQLQLQMPCSELGIKLISCCTFVSLCWNEICAAGDSALKVSAELINYAARRDKRQIERSFDDA
jgi:hypothetical protein